MSCLTWSEVIEAVEPVVRAANRADMDYALAQLRCGVQRSLAEAATGSVETGRCRSITDLLRQAAALLRKGNRYVGFMGGNTALAQATLEDLEKRDHYKYSDQNPTANWIPLHAVIARYLELMAKERPGD